MEIMMAALLADWVLLNLIVLFIAVVALVWQAVCGYDSGRFQIAYQPRRSVLWPDGAPDAFTEAQADLRQRLAAASEHAERRRLDAVVSPFSKGRAS